MPWPPELPFGAAGGCFLAVGGAVLEYSEKTPLAQLFHSMSALALYLWAQSEDALAVTTTTTIATKAVEKIAEKKLVPIPLHRQTMHSVDQLTSDADVMLILAPQKRHQLQECPQETKFAIVMVIVEETTAGLQVMENSQSLHSLHHC